MQNKGFSLDVLRQVLSLAYLYDHDVVKNRGTTCVIGDGFGTMTGLLLDNGQQRVVLVNLTKTLLMDLWQLSLFLGNHFNEVLLINDEGDVDEAIQKTEGRASVIAVEASNHELIRKFPLDLTINIVSMQEMNPEVVDQYFEDISIATSPGGTFYCCNREEKKLPDGTKTIFESYPWALSSKTLDDELCPWNQSFYSIKPPFYHEYDGPIRHRLVRF